MEAGPQSCTWREKKLRGLMLVASGVSGNAATRVETFIASKGVYAYGGYPDIDALYQRQAWEWDCPPRTALLYRIQQLTVERVMFAPLVDLRLLVGVGSRVAEHGLNRRGGAQPVWRLPWICTPWSRRLATRSLSLMARATFSSGIPRLSGSLALRPPKRWAAPSRRMAARRGQQRARMAVGPTSVMLGSPLLTRPQPAQERGAV